MSEINKNNDKEIEDLETKEWLESLDYVLKSGGPERVKSLLHNLDTYAHEAGVDLPFTANTPYINTSDYHLNMELHPLLLTV